MAENTGSPTPPVMEKPKTFLRPITERFTPKGCFDTLKKVERVGIEDAINDEVDFKMTNRTEQKEEHAYIGALLRGLESITRISMKPMAEILRDCSMDSDKDKYEDRIKNCFKNASLLSKVRGFLNQVEKICGKAQHIQDLLEQITEMLISINPKIFDIIESHEVRTTEWPDSETLDLFISKCIEPVIKIALKNLFLKALGYPECEDETDFAPSVDSNEMTLKLHEGRITKVESIQTEVSVIKNTLAGEIADLKLAKAASAFAMEEKNLRLNPQDKDAWRKKSEEEKRESIEHLLKELLGDKRGKKVPIRIIKEGHRTPAWIKISLASAEEKFEFEGALKKKRDAENKGKDKIKSFASVRLTPLSFREEEKYMRAAASRKLSEDWSSQLKKQKAEKKWESNIDKLLTMFQLRLKWKNAPTFSVWLEVQDPIHRWSWTPVDLTRDNLFEHYNFQADIPDPLTRNHALTIQAYRVPKPKAPREFDFSPEVQRTPRSRQEPGNGKSISVVIGDQNMKAPPPLPKRDTRGARMKESNISFRNELTCS